MKSVFRCFFLPALLLCEAVKACVCMALYALCYLPAGGAGFSMGGIFCLWAGLALWILYAVLFAVSALSRKKENALPLLIVTLTVSTTATLLFLFIGFVFLRRHAPLSIGA